MILVHLRFRIVRDKSHRLHSTIWLRLCAIAVPTITFLRFLPDGLEQRKQFSVTENDYRDIAQYSAASTDSRGRYLPVSQSRQDIHGAKFSLDCRSNSEKTSSLFRLETVLV